MTKPLLKVLNGEKADHIPFWFMRQAGRYLPEYRELRKEAGSFLDMAYNPDFASEVTLQPIRRFQMDAAIIFSDILVILHALGQHLEFVAGEGPKLDAMRSAQEFKKLNYDRFDEILNPVYEALRKTKKGLIDEGYPETTLIGFCGAPWTVACYMVEGQGSKDYMNVKKLSFADPDSFQYLIDFLVEASTKYLIEKVNAGAEVLQIFDSWAGALDSQSFERWSIQPTKKIVDLVRKTHPHIPIIGFPRCAGTHYIDYVQKTGITAVGLDHAVDTKWAAENLQTHVPV
ncbi:MAG: uroporphyrinogen decarboxylase, partial [Alphaproteobacteria bacterium]|nr:uroporphyrinogen decarboxylase [Alphaproteobacteria bacterium]